MLKEDESVHLLHPITGGSQYSLDIGPSVFNSQWNWRKRAHIVSSLYGSVGVHEKKTHTDRYLNSIEHKEGEW